MCWGGWYEIPVTALHQVRSRQCGRPSALFIIHYDIMRPITTLIERSVWEAQTVVHVASIIQPVASPQLDHLSIQNHHRNSGVTKGFIFLIWLRKNYLHFLEKNLMKYKTKSRFQNSIFSVTNLAIWFFTVVIYILPVFESLISVIVREKNLPTVFDYLSLSIVYSVPGTDLRTWVFDSRNRIPGKWIPLSG